jgi:hypothetical protein
MFTVLQLALKCSIFAIPRSGNLEANPGIRHNLHDPRSAPVPMVCKS